MTNRVTYKYMYFFRSDRLSAIYKQQINHYRTFKNNKIDLSVGTYFRTEKIGIALVFL